MLDLLPDSDDGEIGSEALNSSKSQSSMSNGSSDDRCSCLSRLSFDAAAAAVASKPHRSSDPAWTAIKSRKTNGLDPSLGPKDFKLIRRIGSGDIGTVYLCRLREEASTSPSTSVYAMKVVDKEVLRKKKKMERAETEKRILKILDHPFLPTLYADFDAPPHYSCVVMEYCSGGDLHSLRHRQPGRRFSFNAARFYAAEVLLALEYLHMLGIVYRDLKPENILIRSDGHIMLSDFDLSLESTSSPTLQQVDPARLPVPHADPFCLPDRLFRSKKPPSKLLPSRRFIAEPVLARSNSFVGTHEYVAPEVASGRPHGSAVDWWAYGIFLYEIMYGSTPFVGPTNDATLKNIVKRPLAFPSCSGPADSARDLIAGLLAKDPAVRLGSSCGAADIKAHPFFKGLNFALLRSCRPPVVPGLKRSESCRAESPAPGRFDFF